MNQSRLNQWRIGGGGCVGAPFPQRPNFLYYHDYYFHGQAPFIVKRSYKYNKNQGILDTDKK